MKKLLFTLTLVAAFTLGDQSAFAQAKKKPTAPADAPAAVAEKAKAAAETPKAAAEEAKPKKDTIPMYVRADEIDAKAKTITQINKDGKKAVNTVTATTEIKNGDASAKFDDIKKGDWVAGLRKKTGDAYEVVKITKFGPKAEKKEGEAKKSEGEAKKPEGEAKKPAAEPKKK
jgi:hypothetical protein